MVVSSGKILSLVLLLTCSFMLSACGGTGGAGAVDPSTSESGEERASSGNSDINVNVGGVKVRVGEDGVDTNVDGIVDVKVNNQGVSTDVGNGIKVNTDGNSASVNVGNDVRVRTDGTGANVNVGEDVSVTTDGTGAKVQVGEDVSVDASEDGVKVNVGGMSINLGSDGINMSNPENVNTEELVGGIMSGVSSMLGDDDDE